MSLFFVFPNISNEETGEKFRLYREAAKMSQQQVADLLYVTAQAVSKWETGKSLPNIENLAALMVLYQAGFNDLIVLKKGTGENRSLSFFCRAPRTESLSACRIAIVPGNTTGCFSAGKRQKIPVIYDRKCS